MRFETLVTNGKLNKCLADAVYEEFGFDNMTPVQQACIGNFLSNQDVAVEACTGSGKTLAYLLPVFQFLLNELNDEKSYKGVGALILSPTRELTLQICSVAEKISQYLKKNQEIDIKVTSIIGGGSIEKTLNASISQDSNIIVSTPGRLNDLLTRFGASVKDNLKNLQVLILDEADELLELGFERSIENILSSLPRQRRTGLFSATQTSEIKKLVRAGLRNPAVIQVKIQHFCGDDKIIEKRVPDRLENYYTILGEDEKLSFLLSFITSHCAEKIIVFFSTCACVEFFSLIFKALLEQRNVLSSSTTFIGLHGKMPQKKRERSMKGFLEAGSGVLFCTDVAARGVDFPKVNWIVQFHPPKDPSFFVHRVGRTARAGNDGKALLFLLPSEESYVHFIQNRDIPLVPLSSGPFKMASEFNILEFIKEIQLEDRLILEKGTQAFISHLRAYKEHKLNFIFRIADLDLLKVAAAFVLFQVPKLSELRLTSGIKGFLEVDRNIVKNIKFKNEVKQKEREEKYKLLLRNKRETPNAPAATFETKPKVKSLPKAQQVKKNTKKKGRHQQIMEEWEDLAEEERAYKKFKKNKISKEEYERLLTEFS